MSRDVIVYSGIAFDGEPRMSLHPFAAELLAEHRVVGWFNDVDAICLRATGFPSCIGVDWSRGGNFRDDAEAIAWLLDGEPTAKTLSREQRRNKRHRGQAP